MDQDMADLSAELMMVAEKALPYVEGTLHKIAAGFLEAGAAVQTVAEVIGSTFEAIGASAIAGGQMMADAASGNYGALLQDAKTAKDQFVDIWKSPPLISGRLINSPTILPKPKQAQLLLRSKNRRTLWAMALAVALAVIRPRLR